MGQIERFELVLAERTVVYDTATPTYFRRNSEVVMNVLISHAQDERDLAGAWKELLTSISDGAINVWYSSDLAPDGGLRAGFEWRDELYRRIAESQAIIVIQTASSTDRPWIMWECGVASGVLKERRLIPLVYGISKEDVASPLNTYQIFSGEQRREVERICMDLAADAELKLAPDVFDAAFATHERTLKTVLPPKVTVSARDVVRERDRVRVFCRRVAGWWWERIENDGIGFFELQMDDLHNSVQLQNGHFYDESGSWIAEYSSGLARVSPDKPRIVYIRECRRPERDAETFVHGYGDMSFRGAADSFSNGSGLFYDVTVDDRRKMVQKSVRLGRVVDRADIDKLASGADIEEGILARTMLQRLRTGTPG